MDTHANKSQENRQESQTKQSADQQYRKDPTFQFVDKRPEAQQQRRLIDIMNNSHRVKQLRKVQDMADRYTARLSHPMQRRENKLTFQTEQLSKQQHTNTPTFQFVDNRPEAKQQLRLIEMMNNGHTTKQLKKEEITDNHTTQQESPIQKKENNTGLPDNLKSGIENLSGYSMNDVKVHYNSDKPAQLQAHAYAQGTDIHLGPGQEQHLPHEAWHVVQQKQGRVRPTMQMKGKVNINDNVGLEREADLMGEKAGSQLHSPEVNQINHKSNSIINSPTIQRYPMKIIRDTNVYKDERFSEKLGELQAGAIVWRTDQAVPQIEGDEDFTLIRYADVPLPGVYVSSDVLNEEFEQQELEAIWNELVNSDIVSAEDLISRMDRISGFVAADVFRALKGTEAYYDPIIQDLSEPPLANLSDVISNYTDELDHVLKEPLASHVNLELDPEDPDRGWQSEQNKSLSELIRNIESGKVELSANALFTDIDRVRKLVSEDPEGAKGYCIAQIRGIMNTIAEKVTSAEHFEEPSEENVIHRIRRNIQAYLVQADTAPNPSQFLELRRNFLNSAEFNSCMHDAEELMRRLAGAAGPETARNTGNGVKTVLRLLQNDLMALQDNPEIRVMTVTIGTHGFLLIAQNNQVWKLEGVAAGYADDAIAQSMWSSFRDPNNTATLEEWIKLIEDLKTADNIDETLSARVVHLVGMSVDTLGIANTDLYDKEPILAYRPPVIVNNLANYNERIRAIRDGIIRVLEAFQE